MIKVLIVDDEPLILIGIQSMLQWNQLGYSVVGAARNGAQALEMIEKRHPDIVISDVKMPVMDGLELAERCREKGSLPVFIILTSYEEVSLVRRSISSGVVEYLIKMELTADSLEHALSRAANRVQKENALLDPHPDLKVLQNRFFTCLLTGQLTDEARSEQQRVLELDLDAPCYRLALCGFTTEGGDTEQLRTLCSGVYDMTGTLLRAEARCFTFLRDMHCFGLLFCLDEADTAEDTLKALLAHTSHAIFNYFSVTLLWAVSQPMQSLAEIADEHRRVSALLPLADAQEPILFCSGPLPETMDRRGGVITEVQDYICANLDKRLTLNEVAQVFNISPTYLSHLFGQYGDSGFVEYITEARIQRAKELLEKGELMIYEISDRLGFENAGYFSRVFKKIVGVSPRDYIQSRSGSPAGKGSNP